MEHLDIINSTNLYIKENYKKMKSGHMVTTNHQTSGYGRMGRNWYDNKSGSLMFSLYLKVPLQYQISLLTQLTAASIYQALTHYGIQSEIKWPNDILINDKKVCGILLENIIDTEYAHVIIGVGLNVNIKTFHNELSNKATSMALQMNREFDKFDVLEQIKESLNTFYNQYLNHHNQFLNICRTHSYVIGKEVVLMDKNQKVYVKGINDDGQLIIIKDDQERLYNGSEITLTSLYQNKE